jgi:hypothetical protein
MEIGAVVSLVIGPVIVLFVPTLVWSEPIVRLRRKLQAKIKHSFKAIAAQVALSTR